MGNRWIWFVTFLLLMASSCTNPMVSYLLRKDPIEDPAERTEEAEREWLDTSPVAFYNNVWYDSLREAVDAESGGTPAVPSVIEIRRDITGPYAMGGNEITLASGKHIQLKPYTPDTVSVLIQRWDDAPPLFTVEPGASLTLDSGTTINGDNGYGVYVFEGAVFTVQGSSEVSSVYLKGNAKISLSGILSAYPVALIDPEFHLIGQQVLEGTFADIANNHKRFDVSPELPDASGWTSPPCWRVDSSGKLFIAAVKRDKEGIFDYYTTIQEAAADSEPYSAPVKNNIIIANIDLGAADQINITRRMRFTVSDGNTFTIKRTASTTNYMFNINGGSLELAAETGSALYIDGGAVWDKSPADGGTNSGVDSTKPLIYVRGASTVEKLTINAGVVLRNNDRRGPDYFGGAVECAGAFEMNGGAITYNRTSGFGGAVYFRKNYHYARTINGGSINNNDAAFSGGGFMLDLAGECKITMTGGEIRENRAGGKVLDGNLVNSNCNGYGGGVFIPGPSITLPLSYSSEFIMSGGVIMNNISASGQGNGVVIDRIWTPAPRFVMTGTARLQGNDVYLSRKNSSMNDCTIEIIPPLIYSPAAAITINDTFYPSSGAGPQVLSGDLTQYAKFTSGRPGYSIQGDGSIWKD